MKADKNIDIGDKDDGNNAPGILLQKQFEVQPHCQAAAFGCTAAVNGRLNLNKQHGLVWALLLLILLFVFLPATTFAAPEPKLGAEGAVLLDAQTGCVLWEQDAFKLLEPASTTKILTALVTLDMNVLVENTTVSQQTAAVGESSAHLQPGEVFTVENLLKGALVKSANDACFAVGEAVAGSEPLFVDWMRLKAQSVGAYDARIANTNGLPAEDHLLSAYDLALIARADLQKPLFRQIVSSQYIKMEGGKYNRTFKNTNKLLFANSYVIGIKTGTTDNAGACLVSAMVKDGRTVIAVVLHSPDRYGESLQLLNYGIENFTNLKYIVRGERLGYYPLEDAKVDGVFAVSAGDGIYTIPKKNPGALEIKYSWLKGKKNVKQGDVLGTAILRQGSEKLQYVDLVAEKSVSYGLLQRIWQKLSGQ